MLQRHSETRVSFKPTSYSQTTASYLLVGSLGITLNNQTVSRRKATQAPGMDII